MISNYLTYHASLARRNDLARQTAEAGRANEELAACPTRAGREPRGMPRTRVRGRGYYNGLAMRLSADARAVEIGDGGVATWTAWLDGQRERTLSRLIHRSRTTDRPGQAAEAERLRHLLSNTRNARSASCSNGVRGPFTTIPEGPLLRRGG